MLSISAYISVVFPFLYATLQAIIYVDFFIVLFLRFNETNVFHMYAYLP